VHRIKRILLPKYIVVIVLILAMLSAGIIVATGLGRSIHKSHSSENKQQPKIKVVQ
jgi:hypothetical protein